MLAPRTPSTQSPTTGNTETTAPINLIGIVTTLVRTHPDKNTRLGMTNTFIEPYPKQ